MSYHGVPEIGGAIGFHKWAFIHGGTCWPLGIVSLLTSSRWPCSPPDSISIPHWQDCEHACSYPEPVIFTPLGVGGRESMEVSGCPSVLLWGSGKLAGAVSHPCFSDMLIRLHPYFLCCCAAQEGGREAMRGLLPPQIPLRKWGTVFLCLNPHPAWTIHNFFGGR